MPLIRQFGSRTVPAGVLGELPRSVFVHAWLCLLTREMATPDGSAIVPLVEFFNHAPDAGAAVEWSALAAPPRHWDEEGGGVVVTALRGHAAGDEVRITYGVLSNPLLFRTYGFTVPPEDEPVWTCTFGERELVEACRAVRPELADECAELPNLHLASDCLTETLAVLLVRARPAGESRKKRRSLRSRSLAPRYSTKRKGKN